MLSTSNVLVFVWIIWQYFEVVKDDGFYWVIVRVKCEAFPEVDIYPRHQTVFEGESASISCTAKGIPRPAISWTFDNGKLPPDSAIRNFSNQSILVLSNTSKRLEGWYTCNASNEAGDTSINSTLHVLEKPTVTMSPNPHPSLIEGERLTLTCQANEDTKEIRWTKDDVPVDIWVYQNGNNSTLVIKRVLTSDSGKYSCEAVNEAGSASSTVDIRVTAFPVVDVYPRKQTVLEGGPTLMTCVAKGVPLPAISWTFGNGELPPDATIRNIFDQSILELSKTSKRMEGLYTCRASNAAGDAFANSTLHVLANSKATVQWYFIVGPLLAVTVLAFIVLYLWKRRSAGTHAILNP
ncbi:peroxidasin homolog [Acropora millepora]|uniref:peroxidasin homolog n=1 Tax=Acropora millepora TaxID=45264 RepID=UPI001CF2BA4E|nr:peroxidasin homolog [Acropora millepora]